MMLDRTPKRPVAAPIPNAFMSACKGHPDATTAIGQRMLCFNNMQGVMPVEVLHRVDANAQQPRSNVLSSRGSNIGPLFVDKAGVQYVYTHPGEGKYRMLCIKYSACERCCGSQFCLLAVTHLQCLDLQEDFGSHPGIVGGGTCLGRVAVTAGGQTHQRASDILLVRATSSPPQQHALEGAHDLVQVEHTTEQGKGIPKPAPSLQGMHQATVCVSAAAGIRLHRQNTRHMCI